MLILKTCFNKLRKTWLLFCYFLPCSSSALRFTSVYLVRRMFFTSLGKVFTISYLSGLVTRSTNLMITEVALALEKLLADGVSTGSAQL